MKRSFEAMADADLTLVVVDLSQPLEPGTATLHGARRGAGPLAAGREQVRPAAQAGLADCPAAPPSRPSPATALPQLRAAILEAVAPRGAFEQETGFITSIRHERLLRECAASAWRRRAPPRGRQSRTRCCCSISTRALAPIDAITGATTADDILNRIFSTFCIGK